MVGNKHSGFYYPEFGVIEQEAETTQFIMSVAQWVENTLTTLLLQSKAVRRLKRCIKNNQKIPPTLQIEVV